jgi:preprotein translocase subunit SecF
MASFAKFGNDLYTGARSFDFVGRRRIWYSIAFVLIAASVLLPILRGGFVFGIEFSGGSQFQISGVANVDQRVATNAVLSVVPQAAPRVSTVGTDSVRVQTEQLTPDVSTQVRDALASAYHVTTDQVTSSFIGPSWGADITGAAIRALIVFVVLAAILMAIYFRTWKMSLAAIVSLFHDMIITVGVYGAFGFEITPAAVIGFLTILGYSLYDTVVVFDKIRENTGEASGRTFAESVNLAVNQTLVRSINTGVVAALPVGAILLIGTTLLGAGTLRDISLALFVGIIVGTYSTIFIAAPFYSQLRENEPANAKAAKKTKSVTTRSTSGATR